MSIGDKSFVVFAATTALAAGALFGLALSPSVASNYAAPSAVRASTTISAVRPVVFTGSYVSGVQTGRTTVVEATSNEEVETLASANNLWVTAAAAGLAFSAASLVLALLRKPRSEETYAMLAEAAEVGKAPWTAPKLEDALKNEKARQKAEALSTQLPVFWDLRDALGEVPKSKFPEVFARYKGSTGTLLSAAKTEEYYAITWTSPKTQIYELPTGGAAEMDEGLNIMYFARKEQCLALGAQLRTKFKPRIENFAIYRVFPNGETQYLHPKDGVFPEKVNQGRTKANHNPRSIGENKEPASVKFTGTTPKDVQTEGAVAMFAETGEKAAKPAWTVPDLADALKNTSAVAKAKGIATQLPTFWELRDALSEVPKSKFPEVFASYKGSTGTLLSAAEKEEKYVITWTSPKKQIFELPTGGAAEMEEGENIFFFARKEQCLALGAQLRTAFKPRIENFQIFRVFPNGEVQYLHPKDGVFPEKVNQGRTKANHNPRSIGENAEPASVKFTGTTPKDVQTEGAVAMFAETGEKAAKPAWTVPNLSDALKNTAAVAKAKEIATQLPTFWELRDALSEVPKSKFPEVFASYKGSTGTLLAAAEKEEKYVITWTSPKKQIFELPTGGAAEMEEGENIFYFARKEQCLALGAQLRTAFKPRIENFQIFRVFPNGEVQYLHPKDGVFPEKVNQGRTKANHNPRSIGENAEPASVKFTGTTPKDVQTEGAVAMFSETGEKLAKYSKYDEEIRKELGPVAENNFVIFWDSNINGTLTLPTGATAEMKAGRNRFWFATEEQCLALNAQLQDTFKITDAWICEVTPNGGKRLHPKEVAEGAVAMFAETAVKDSKPAWQVPDLADALKNEAAVQKAKEISTQLPTFWEVRDALSEVPKSQFPEVFANFKGSTGTLLGAAEKEEKYVITWTSSKKQIFELPTGGAAEMEEGENVFYFSRKEQCLALGAQLRTAFKPRIENFQIFRVFPNGEVQYLHPKDGVFPEKVNAGRQQANHNARSIGENVEPASVKFSGSTPKDL